MNSKAILVRLTTLCVCLGASMVRAGDPPSTAFTYQGRLTQAGAPVNGSLDLEFRLFAAPIGGAMLARNAATLPVAEGVFTAALDFGASAFPGEARWLEIACEGTTLLPRQPITPLPYALRALSVTAVNVESLPAGGAWSLASSLDFDSGTLHVDPAGNRVGVGTSTPGSVITNSRLDVAGGHIAVSNDYGFLSRNATGDGIGAGVDTTPNDELALLSNGAERMRITAAGHVGIGTSAPLRPLHVVNNNTFIARFENSNIFTAVTEFRNSASNTTWELDVGGTSPPFGLPAGTLYFRPTSVSAPLLYIDTTGRVGVQRLEAYASSGTGVYGSSFSGTGVSGVSNSTSGVYGAGWTGVEGFSLGGNGVIGQGSTGTGVRGYGISWGVYSNGNFGASGSKSFRIDHPLDPENKYLLHYCSEGPEPQNIYNGIVTLNDAGEALIELPEYYSEINRDPRYALTPIGAAMPNLHLAQEVVGNTFQIAGGAPGKRVSWEVKAVRNDRWVRQRGAPVEVDKPDNERGQYQHPELYGLPLERGTNDARPRPHASLFEH